MQISLDVVDLLQLQEIWSRRPIVTAFTRLETRPTLRPSPDSFKVDDLIPRLSRLKYSPSWLSRRANNTTNDPARIALGDLSDDHLLELYPEAESAKAKRGALFTSAYNCYLVARYDGSVVHTAAALQFLTRARRIERGNFLDSHNMPIEGSPEWIPMTITDEIRGLDDRYDSSEPGAPSTYVVAEEFWPLLLKALPEDVDAAVALAIGASDAEFGAVVRLALQELIALAHTWYRSPSVVGLSYQRR